jgi:hypothetical protein
MVMMIKKTTRSQPMNTKLSDSNTDHNDKDRKVNTTQPAGAAGAPDLPHERDQSTGAQQAAPRKDMQQAASDLADGQVDTDLHNQPGIEKVVPESAKTGAGVPAARPKTGA